MSQGLAVPPTTLAYPTLEGFFMMSSEDSLPPYRPSFRVVAAGLSETVLVIDAEGAVRYASPPAEDLVGLSPERLRGVDVFGFLHPDDRGRALRDFTILLEGGHLPGPSEFRMVRYDGTTVHVEASGRNLLDDPDVEGMVVTVRDVSARVQMEERLREAHRELEAANRRLMEHDELKSQFFANVSHELRTPLTLILGPTDRLLAEEEPSAEERRAQLRLIRRNARSLLDYVEDLLDVVTADAGALRAHPEEVELERIVGVVTDQFHTFARERGVRFSVHREPVPVAHLDARKTERILVNLLSNAFRFTPSGGEIRCELVLAQEESEPFARIRVWDSGPGIPPAEREVVFQRFRQGEGRTHRGGGGTGLGLAIVREFAELQGGRVAVDEGPLGGARLSVWLPLRTEPGEEGAPGAGDAGPIGERAQTEVEKLRTEMPEAGLRKPLTDPDDRQRPRILVVEDHADMAGYLRDVLLPEYEVLIAHDGASGLDTALREEPDLVLTDVMMPGMSGEELIERIRRRPELDSVPILVVTAKAEEELPARLLEKGAQDYVVKPLRAPEIRARVRNLVELTAARRRLQRELGSRSMSLADLTEEVLRQRAHLSRLAEERELLLREVHHRVRGNLQTIMSLLNLQLRRLPDPVPRHVLEESRGRVLSIAILHERLYQTDDPRHVDMGSYLERLVAELARSHGSRERRIETTIDVDRISMEIDQAVPYGLILHELIANAFRHGYPEGMEGGTVRVSFTVEEDGSTVLVVEDDGVGFPESLDPLSAGSLGFEIVTALARRLGGEVRAEGASGSRGARIEVAIPPKRSNPDREESASVGEG